jgi:predicted RNA-binding protein with PUA-like domain
MRVDTLACEGANEMSGHRCWLMKSEPHTFSIDDLARSGRTCWDGVRNYQARNFMKSMRVGDDILFYHSSSKVIGVAGRARVSRAAYPDHTAWDRKSDYFDRRSTPDRPLWYMVDVEFVEKFPEVVTLADIKANDALDGVRVARRGQRLSVQPVDREHFDEIVRMAAERSTVE